MTFTAILMPDEVSGYVALNPETGSASQGETVQEAVANLREATELYLVEFPHKVSVPPLLTTFEIRADAEAAPHFSHAGA